MALDPACRRKARRRARGRDPERTVDVTRPVRGGSTRNPPDCTSRLNQMAERVGFEPTDRLPDQRFSRPSHSTTLAPLRRFQSLAGRAPNAPQPSWCGWGKLAERAGFEPAVEFPLHTLSRRAP